MDSGLFHAFVYLLAAVISVPLAKRFGLGSVLGYLLAGVLIGPHVLQLVGERGGDVMHFAEFGVVMMLFLVGLELQPTLLWNMRAQLLGLGGLQVFGTALVIAGIGLAFGLGFRLPFAAGLILAMSSTAIVLSTLQERGQLKTPGGQSIFAVLLFQDIAVIPVQAPPTFKDQAIPQAMLADETTFAAEHIKAGAEMMTLGYPHGLSANTAGFPILRAGRLASYPLTPSSAYPTFLIDLTAVPGNSGGPVFMTTPGPKGRTFVAGVLIKQVEDDSERLELGVVTDAVFVHQTISLMMKAQASGVRPEVNLKPVEPAPVKTPGGPTTDTEDMTGAKNNPAGQAAKPSGATN